MQENVIIIAFIFFTRYIQNKNFGNQLYQYIFNFFPASILLSNVQSLSESVCVRRTNKYVPINNSEDNDNIQFKIIHLKSRINNQETFNATQEIQSVNKQNGTGIVGSGNSRKTDRSSFSVSIKTPISERKSVRRKRPRFLLKR